MAGHLHPVKDTDVRFEIDAITRKIKATSGKTALIQGDHNSERFTFVLPRHVEGHDMSTCNVVEVHYININPKTKEQKKGVYPVDDLQSEGSDNVVFSWLISRNATRLEGNINFLIRFACVNDGNVEYDWHTAIFSGISVSAGIDNGEAIADEYPDALAELMARVEALENGVVIGGGSGYAVRIAEISLPAAAWQGDESPYSQVVDVPGVTANSQVDLTPSVEQLEIFHDKDLSFVTKNAGGVVTVYAIGQRPENDYLIQATIKEVAV